MCGRYTLFDDKENLEVIKIINEINKKHTNNQMKTGEIFPTNTVPIFVSGGGITTLELSVWGFPGFQGKGSIINARSETAQEKKTFRDSLLNRRCAIPSTGFYEWSKTKEKVYFTMPHSNILYMAGIYKEINDESHFVILTTSANNSVRDIHDRMPVILSLGKMERWITNTDVALNYMHEPMPMILERSS